MQAPIGHRNGLFRSVRAWGRGGPDRSVPFRAGFEGAADRRGGSVPQWIGVGVGERSVPFRVGLGARRIGSECSVPCGLWGRGGPDRSVPFRAGLGGADRRGGSVPQWIGVG
ncbi:hypothetical protein Ade02nite_29740 [Paractinoplanes deccanensis]|uniref:Uncharacterized protein n=1 Tax=Paractinoplanes deccanensis TaxID=113561 RepID=A0ABQ3Y2W2_9ACTN|nr:hypothetical protein Ade02nite_29740 [Actinoplanes deccanensis]